MKKEQKIEPPSRTRLFGKGVVKHRKFPVYDLGDGGFEKPDPNTMIVLAELHLNSPKFGVTPWGSIYEKLW